MLTRDINRYESAWGRRKNSIGLMSDWTIGPNAQTVSHNAQGTGMQGLGDGVDTLLEVAHTGFDLSSLLLWPTMIFAVYSAMTKSEPAVKRRSAIGKARADLRKAKQLSRWRG